MSKPWTEKLTIRHPIILAPMAGGAATPELVASVSNAGGLGSLGAGYMKPHDMRLAIQSIRQLTHAPFAVNLFISQEHSATDQQIQKACEDIAQCCSPLNIRISPVVPPYAPSFEEQIQVIYEEKVPVFSFTFGLLDAKWIEKLKSDKTMIIGTATTLPEAQALEKIGVDMIVVQGSEAGGYRGTFLGKEENRLIDLPSLILQCIDHIKIPIIAAGGIMDGRGIVAAMALGASGVQMGTAFLSCDESGIHAQYKEVLLTLKNDTTALTRAFSGKLARGIRNQFMTCMATKNENILTYPIQNALTQRMRQKSKEMNSTEYMSMWAGQRAYLCRSMSAHDLMLTLMMEMQETVHNNDYA